MSIRDRLDKFLDYFTEDGEEVEASLPRTPKDNKKKEAEVSAKTTIAKPKVQESQEEVRKSQVKTEIKQSSVEKTTMKTNENITRLHARQQELAQHREVQDKKVTIDVRYPRKYEEATEVVDLLIANESILIDFQYMTEVQARRCLDYLDGARYVLAGNLRKVASTMYLLTPINVVVNIEDIRLPDDTQIGEFDYDMKRRQ